MRGRNYHSWSFLSIWLAMLNHLPIAAVLLDVHRRPASGADDFLQLAKASASLLETLVALRVSATEFIKEKIVKAGCHGVPRNQADSLSTSGTLLSAFAPLGCRFFFTNAIPSRRFVIFITSCRANNSARRSVIRRPASGHLLARPTRNSKLVVCAVTRDWSLMLFTTNDSYSDSFRPLVIKCDHLLDHYLHILGDKNIDPWRNQHLLARSRVQ